MSDADNRQRARYPDEMFCSSCGEIIKKEAEICPKCGVRQKPASGSPSKMDVSANWLTLLLLSIFLGELGVDRFYVGKVGTGILKLVTVGGCGIWWLIDLILILCEKFTDSNGNVVRREG
jgi:RNA polymerase subunit RPABC4/transcription elongation factor Spt4